jgi:hypothetical protein
MRSDNMQSGFFPLPTDSLEHGILKSDSCLATEEIPHPK